MSQQIGAQLTQARQDRSLSLEKASQETYIRLHYLQALEAGDLAALPSPAHARGFLRAYASYLGLEADQLLAEVGIEGRQPGGELAADRIPAAESRPPVSETAEAIFQEIGAHLRQQRELLGFSLDDVEQHIHVRRHYLSALETGELGVLPSPVQGRGMLKNYCSFLGLETDPMLLRYADGLQAQHALRLATKTGPPPQRGLVLPFWLRRLVSGDLIFGGLLILGLAVFVIWGAIRINSMRALEVAEPTAPFLEQALVPTLTLTPTPPSEIPTPGEPNPAEIGTTETAETPEAVLPPVGQGAVQVYVVVQGRAWMRAIVDDEVEFEGRVIPGSAYQFSGADRVEILTGNAAALRVYYNQVDLGQMGILGEVVDRVFTQDGIATPTATATPTETITPRTTPTAFGTSTPLPENSTPPAP